MTDSVDSTARLKWLCRRGMRELDKVTDGYLTTHYEKANSAEKQAFRAMLDMPDPDLLALLFGTNVTDDPSINQILNVMRNLSNQAAP